MLFTLSESVPDLLYIGAILFQIYEFYWSYITMRMNQNGNCVFCILFLELVFGFFLSEMAVVILSFPNPLKYFFSHGPSMFCKSSPQI